MNNRKDSAFLFDLDGTLIDSVYQHVSPGARRSRSVGIDLAVWKIHRRIGMSGGLFVTALRRELGDQLDDETLDAAAEPARRGLHAPLSSVRPLPGAGELLAGLTEMGSRGRSPPAAPSAPPGRARAARARPRMCRWSPATRSSYAKPDPDLFLAAAPRIGVDIRDSIVVGDSVWDLLAARARGALGIGLLSGGYGREELIYAGAFRVYEDPGDLLAHLDEVGVRRSG